MALVDLMTDEAPHPGDILIATALLLGATFEGNEWDGITGVGPGRSTKFFFFSHCKRACAAGILQRMGYKIGVDGDVTK